jgi:4-amino-4-deoxy-L-arabinose transferase-like glycosyltransferase
MRLPSLVFSIVAAFFVYRIARRLIDAETARIAVIAFAVWPSVVFAASDVRPYALATLVVVASTWALIGWLDTGRLYAAAGYVLLAALMPCAPRVQVVLIPHAIYAWARIVKDRLPCDDAMSLSPCGAIVILVIPVVLELLALWRRRGSRPAQGSDSALGGGSSRPTAFVGAAVIGGIIAAPKLRIGTDLRRLPRSTLILMIGWLLIPTAILLGLSVLWSIDLLEARYLLCMTPAAVLLAAVAARTLEPAQVRRMIVLLVVVLSVLDLAAPVKSGDFRGAASLVRSVADERSVILVPSGFQESMDQRWFVNPNRQAS